MAVFVCPKCSHTQAAPDEYLGRTAKCLKCEARGEITKSKLPPPSPPTPSVPAFELPGVSTNTDESPSGPAFSRTEARAIIGLLAALLAAQLFGLTSTKTSTTKWEYKIESPTDGTFDLAVERLGNEGWELVFARRATSEFGSASYEMILKRPKR